MGPDFWIGLGVGILGICVTIVIFIYQEREPRISVECELDKDANPSVIHCTVHNSGRGEGKDIYLGFNGILPAQTMLFSNPEYGIEIHETPHKISVLSDYPNSSKILVAFSVFIPRISKKSRIDFEIKTMHPQNIRASKQIVIIRKDIENIIRNFYQRLYETGRTSAITFDVSTLISARHKEENFFHPGTFSYKSGKFPITFFTDDEKISNAIHSDLYAKYKARDIDLFKSSSSYEAPLLRITTVEGEANVTIFPPYVSSYVIAQANLSEIKEKGYAEFSFGTGAHNA
ncbi:MAG: hypothetical protein HY910_00525 [Desulfarculus sp.]|nr:hypothetical protein [Desulfarculus sp.]